MISETILQKYAEVLVNFALNHGQGVKAGEVVMLKGNVTAEPLLKAIHDQILKSGGHPMVFLLPPDRWKTSFFAHAQNDEQVGYFAEPYEKMLTDTIDHSISIIADDDPNALKEANPEKVIMKQQLRGRIRKWLEVKEHKNRFSWTLANYGTEAMAQEANLSLKEYWQQIIQACFLDEANPIEHWRQVNGEIETTRQWLNGLDIKKVHVHSEHNDLTVEFGPERQWLGGRGANIPSFELFISPYWPGVNGVMAFDQPLYRYGNIIRDIRFEFKDGLLVDYSAGEGEALLKEIVEQPNAHKVGEFSLTDRRFSRIDRFMADTLYDENYGGQYGNTHIAIGSAYKDSYRGDPQQKTKEDWQELGFNESPEHLDFVSTENREVTATLQDGSTKVIYRDGQFQR